VRKDSDNADRAQRARRAQTTATMENAELIKRDFRRRAGRSEARHMGRQPSVSRMRMLASVA
jgi:hypothetical protein